MHNETTAFESCVVCLPLLAAFAAPTWLGCSRGVQQRSHWSRIRSCMYLTAVQLPSALHSSQRWRCCKMCDSAVRGLLHATGSRVGAMDGCLSECANAAMADRHQLRLFDCIRKVPALPTVTSQHTQHRSINAGLPPNSVTLPQRHPVCLPFWSHPCISATTYCCRLP